MAQQTNFFSFLNNNSFVPSLSSLSIGNLDWDGIDQYYELTNYFSNKYGNPHDYHQFLWCNCEWFVGKDVRMDEFSKDWLIWMKTRIGSQSGETLGDRFVLNSRNFSCSLNWFLFLKSHDFEFDILEELLPWYTPNLSRFFELCGDVESNPGPTANEILSIHKVLYKLETLLQVNVPLKPQIGLPSFITDSLNIPGMSVDVIARFGRIAHRVEAFLENPQSNPVFANYFSNLVFPDTVTTNISLVGILLTFILIILLINTRNVYLISSFALLSLYFFRWDMKVIEKIQELVGKFSKTLRPQMNIDNSHVLLGGQILFALLAYLGVSAIPHQPVFDSLIRRLDLIPKAITGAHKIWEHAGHVFDIVADEFRVWILGQKRDQLASAQSLKFQVEKWATGVTKFLEIKKRRDLMLSGEDVTEVMELFMQMHKWRSPKYWSTIPNDLKLVINNFVIPMNEIYHLVCKSHSINGGPRSPPTTVLFSGDSGCGKSDLLTPFITSLFASRGWVGKEYSNQIYCRNYETEFWDGYCGQAAVYVDDAFQRRDSASNPSPEYMEAIRMANSAPFMVHMADLHDKGTFFNSSFVIYTTNMVDDPSKYIQSIICPEAAIRRITEMAFRVKPSQNYSFQKVVGGKLVDRLDTTAISNCTACKLIAQTNNIVVPWCKHCMCFERYDMFTGNALSQLLTYDEMVAEVIAYDQRFNKRQDAKTAFYKTLFEKPDILNVPLNVNAPVFVPAAVPSTSGLKPQMDEDDPHSFLAMMAREEEDEFVEVSTGEGKLDLSNDADLLAYCVICKFDQIAEQSQLHDGGLWCLQVSEWWPFWKRFHEFGIDNDQKVDNKRFIKFARQSSQEILTVLDRTRFSAYRENCLRALRADCEKIKRAAQEWYENLTVYKIISLIGGIATIGGVIFGMSKLFSSFTGDNSDILETEIASSAVMIPTKPATIKTEIASSAVVVPNKPAQIKTEIASSAAIALPKPACIKTEIASSATTAPPRTAAIKTEIASSACVALPKVSSIKTEMQSLSVLRDVQTQQQQLDLADVPRNVNISPQMDNDMASQLVTQGICDQNAYSILLKVLNQSLYCLHSNNKIFGNALFIKGTTFLIPYHFISCFKNIPGYKADDILYLSSHVAKGYIKTTVGEVIRKHVRLYKNGFGTDTCLVALDPVKSQVNLHADISHLFISSKVISVLTDVYRAYMPSYVPLSNLDDSKFRTMVMGLTSFSGTLDSSIESPELEWKAGNYKLRHFWSYNGITRSGDCGAPLIIFNSFLSQKLVGIHVAGAATGYAVGQLVTQEMLADGFKQISLQSQMCCSFPVTLENLIGDEEIIGSVPANKGVKIIGTVSSDRAVSSSGKSKIKRSILYNAIGNPATCPAMLKPHGEVDPMYLGVLKYGQQNPLIDSRIIEIVSKDIDNLINRNISECNREKYARVLTFEEAVVGVEGDEFLAPINRATSMGYPYTLEKNLKPGKQSFFGTDEWDLENPNARRIQQDVEELIADCAAGIQRGVIWTDTLKDERRPLAKVAAGKTRVFCGGPAHFTIAFRRYFLGFAAWIMHNRNYNEIATGTNVYSQDWDVIVKLLAKVGVNSEKGINVVAGDFTNFDGSLQSQILWELVENINRFYNDGELNFTIRRGLWAHIVNSVHINGNVIYQLSHSQPSGGPLTAIINSLYNCFVIRMAYLKCASKLDNKIEYCNLEAFNRFVVPITYGDDNIIGIHSHIKEWFNQVTITESMSSFGLTYTDEAKTGNIVEIRDISEIAFLKRAFVFDPLTYRFVAPLNIDVVMEIAQWTKVGLNSLDITRANVDVTLRELSLHGREIFDEISGGR